MKPKLPKIGAHGGVIAMLSLSPHSEVGAFTKAHVADRIRNVEDAMDDLNQSTNRLRRKFNPTSNYLETKVQMERVMDSARSVNQVMTRGNYGSQPERYWAALRANINDLARCYGLSTMGV